jgi:CheY-like chemotaxis protein/HPt (histidine-containing phosphotransfer) domain-containing protein
MELESVDFELLPLLDHLAGAAAAQAASKEVEIVSDVDADLPEELHGDPVRLRQILGNLLNNAVKFTARGEVGLRVRMEEKTKDCCVLRFQVRDTGIGIASDKQAMIFDKFSQVDASTTRKFGGSGLGLAICRDLVELMGGKMGVNSQPGAGSEFWCTLPFRVAWMAETSVAEPGFRHRSALIVDDCAGSRAALRRQLEAWEIHVEEAATGSEALRKINQASSGANPFALVFLDMHLPEMDGEAVGRSILGDPRLEATRMVMLTSLRPEFGSERAHASGFRWCVNKPIRRGELHEVLRKLAAEIAPGATIEKVPVSSADNCNPPAQPALPRGRILLVEDNLTNQQLELAILNKMGLSPDVAGNGIEALRAMETVAYDLVMMDLRMPEMDGLAATRRIRDPQSLVLNHAVPILAITANVQKADRDACAEAGMNGFIGKPFSLAEIRQALLVWLSANAPAAAVTPEPPQTVPAPAEEDMPPVFDHDGFKDRLAGDTALMHIVLKGFLEDMPRQFSILREMLEKGETHPCNRQAHSIKGAAANIGAERMRRVACAMEKAAEDGDLDAVCARLPGLEQEFADLQKVIAVEKYAG